MRYALKFLGLSLALAACGPLDARFPLRPSGGRGKATGATPPVTQTPAVPAGVAPASSAAFAAVETTLASGLQVPARLKASTLVVRFSSNTPSAVFECQIANLAAPFSPCPGSTLYDFGALVHGRSYFLRVRAKAPDGRRDETPLQVSFVVDLVSGVGPVAPAPLTLSTARVPETPAELPSPIASQEARAADPDAAAARAVQVGSYYGVIIPDGGLVTAYSTTKTYNDSLHSMTLMAPGPASGVTSPSGTCTQPYERVTPGPGNSTYCDATPTRSQWAQIAQPLPMNHVEMIENDAQGMREKLLVAAFEDEADPSEAGLSISNTCQGALYHGMTQVPLTPGFFVGDTQTESFEWCEVRDPAGVWWWVGAYTALLGNSPTGPRLRVIDTVAAREGITSGSEFATRAESRLTGLILPLAPVSGSQ